jgi:hypothetical protein
MNPPTTLRPETVERPRFRVGLALAAAVLALATAVALTFVVDLGGGPSTVPRLTYQNPTDYALDVEVSSGPGAGWTPAGHVDQRATGVANDVVDQGDVWLFRFSSQGVTTPELRLTRAELVASGWTVDVPTDIGRQLAETGAPRSP